jgi:hypothetical protein
MLDTLENPRAKIGDNCPPTDPFGAIEAHINDLYDEAKNWCDGAAIENEGQAESVQTLMRMLQEAHRLADETRQKENEPFDAGKAEVQERYAPLIADTKKQVGKTVKAVAALKGALTTWLRAKELERQAEADRLRKEAEVAAQAALEASLAAHQGNDLGAIEAAETTIAEARDIELAARRVENTTAKATGMGRAVGLRDNWIATLANPREALLHYLATDPDAVRAWLSQRGQQDVRSGRRLIPGFAIENQPVAA